MGLVAISVIIPAYNAEKFLGDTIKSVLLQSHPAHEIIVVDDGSNDATAEVALSFGHSVRYIHQRNAGVSAARNTAISAATGEWIAFLDSDDLMLPDKLWMQAAVIDGNPDLAVVYSNFTYLKKDGLTADQDHFHAAGLWPALRYRTPILPSTALVLRDALLAVGGFKAGHNYAEDWDLWLRLMLRYGPDAFADVIGSLTLYRQWENNATGNFMPMAKATLGMLDTVLLDGLTGIRRRIWRRKIEARIYYRLALSLREAKDCRYWAFAVASFLDWPLCGSIVPLERYRVIALMLLTRLRHPRLKFRYWWPERRCREYVGF